jgi:uncharacterized protein YpmS
MNTRRALLLSILALVALYLMYVALYLMYVAARPPVRVQADADQKNIPGFSITSTDVFAA